MVITETWDTAAPTYCCETITSLGSPNGVDGTEDAGRERLLKFTGESYKASLSDTQQSTAQCTHERQFFEVTHRVLERSRGKGACHTQRGIMPIPTHQTGKPHNS